MEKSSSFIKFLSVKLPVVLRIELWYSMIFLVVVCSFLCFYKFVPTSWNKFAWKWLENLLVAVIWRNRLLINSTATSKSKTHCSFTDVPSAPQGPLKAIDTSPNAITLQWKPPLDDGGSRIEKYVLEKKLKGSSKWQKVPVNILPDETEATAKNLEEGQEYDFRVMAVNENGESAPLATTEPIKAKYPFGRFSYEGAIVHNLFWTKRHQWLHVSQWILLEITFFNRKTLGSNSKSRFVQLL